MEHMFIYVQYKCKNYRLRGSIHPDVISGDMHCYNITSAATHQDTG